MHVQLEINKENDVNQKQHLLTEGNRQSGLVVDF